MFALVYTDEIGYKAHVELYGNELAFSPSCKDAFASSKLAPSAHVRFTDDHTVAPPELSLEYASVLHWRHRDLNVRACGLTSAGLLCITCFAVLQI